MEAGVELACGSYNTAGQQDAAQDIRLLLKKPQFQSNSPADGS